MPSPRKSVTVSVELRIAQPDEPDGAAKK